MYGLTLAARRACSPTRNRATILAAFFDHSDQISRHRSHWRSLDQRYYERDLQHQSCRCGSADVLSGGRLVRTCADRRIESADGEYGGLLHAGWIDAEHFFHQVHGADSDNADHDD